MKRLTIAIIACALAACGGGSGTPGGADAAHGVDGTPGTADAPPGTVDAPPGTTIDAPPGTTIDAGGMMGGTDGGGGPGVTCGMMSCTAAQTCCVSGGMGGMPTYACLDPGTACMGGTVACDGPEDCTMGNSCCGSGGPGGGGGSTMCSTSGACTGMSVTLCHADADCPAGMGGTMGPCCPASGFIPYSYCSLFGGMCF